MPARRTSRSAAILAVLLAAAAKAQKKPAITDAWDRLLEDTAGETHSTAVPMVAPAPATESLSKDFLNDFFLEGRSEFVRQQIGFSGEPTTAGFTVLQNVFPGPFQPSANTIYQTLNFGTRGWLSPRIGTDFSLRYAQDLTPVESGSPALSALETFRGHRRAELTEAVVSVKGLAGDGAFA